MNRSHWYPPAEPAVSPRAMMQAVLHPGDGFLGRFREYLGVERCVLGVSGRALLCRLLTALRGQAGPGRTIVLVPGYTCYSVAASVVKAGLKIACYDLDPVTFHPDMDSVHARADGRTLAVIGQHLFGIPTPMEELGSAARDVGARLIEDAAQGLGGAMNGRRLGTGGDYGLFSFGRGKPLPLGGGGALTGSDPWIGSLDAGPPSLGISSLLMALASRILSSRRVYGILESLPLGLGETVFDPGFSLRSMPQALQRLGTHAMHELETLNSHRRATALTYRDMLADAKPLKPSAADRAVFPRYPVMAGPHPVPVNLYRLGVRRMYPKAILDEPAIAPYTTGNDVPTPGASAIAERLVTLPTHTGITLEVARDIACGLREAYPC